MAKTGTMTTEIDGRMTSKYIIEYEIGKDGETIFSDKWYTENEWKQLKRKEKLKKINEMNE